MNANRRRMAASTMAMDRSAVFMVPMMNRLRGNRNEVSGLYWGRTVRSRYSSRKYISPKTRARSARFISSMMRKLGCSRPESDVARAAWRRSGPACRAKPG